MNETGPYKEDVGVEPLYLVASLGMESAYFLIALHLPLLSVPVQRELRYIIEIRFQIWELNLR